MEKLTDNKEFFKRYGIKNTKQRNIILEILKQAKDPLTAEQIFLESKKLDDSISLSTIYRVLNTFISKGIVVKLTIVKENISMYELNHTDHEHYLVCMKCNKAIDIGHCPLGVYESSLEDATEFEIVGHKLEMYGYCPECKKKK
ncbi:MAG: transcriptional repressor [Clostridiaceae bacterium]|nr:transcriptional repressor [Clostridiaceae bacterium]MBW4860441.1 transcriptional repressor [Clostridiaceae bacterium]MBW4868357.1 transcriptional repressor [Clostridiaceae bacterium]